MIAEDAVLGSIIKEPYLINETDLKAEHLTIAVNKNILMTMKKLEEEGKSIDLVSILTTGEPNSFGGAANLTRIQAAANPNKFDEHIEIIMDKWRSREKLNILQIASHENWDIDEIVKKLRDLTSNKTNDHQTITKLLTEVYESPWIKQTEIKGSPSGLASVDRVTGGWQDSDLIILAARPSMGKTDVMLQFAKYAGWSDRIPIIFSLEMPAVKLRDRLLASVGKYNRGKFKNLERFMSKEEKERWLETSASVNRTNIQIFDKPRQSISEMRMKIRRTLSEHPGKKPVIFIDYLTLIKSTNFFGGNMHLQVSEIVQELKSVAKEYECPVICLAQLSRGVEQRQDKRPILSDLRESGGIEETADVVIFLYRDSYYSIDEENKEMEMVFAKNRNGETGRVKIHYDKTTGELRI